MGDDARISRLRVAPSGGRPVEDGSAGRCCRSAENRGRRRGLERRGNGRRPRVCSLRKGSWASWARRKRRRDVVGGGQTVGRRSSRAAVAPRAIRRGNCSLRLARRLRGRASQHSRDATCRRSLGAARKVGHIRSAFRPASWPLWASHAAATLATNRPHFGALTLGGSTCWRS